MEDQIQTFKLRQDLTVYYIQDPRGICCLDNLY